MSDNSLLEKLYSSAAQFYSSVLVPSLRVVMSMFFTAYYESPPSNQKLKYFDLLENDKTGMEQSQQLTTDTAV